MVELEVFMTRRWASVVGIVMVALTSLFVTAVTSAPQLSPALNATDRGAGVAAAARMLRERYVFPDIGDQAARAIELKLGSGGYEGLTQVGAFAQQLTEELRAIARDKHLRVIAPGAPAAAPTGAAPPRA